MSYTGKRGVLQSLRIEGSYLSELLEKNISSRYLKETHNLKTVFLYKKRWKSISTVFEEIFDLFERVKTHFKSKNRPKIYKVGYILPDFFKNIHPKMF